MEMECKALVVVCGLVAVFLIAGGSAQYDPHNMISYDEKFVMGVKAYAQDKWSDAIIYIRCAT